MYESYILPQLEVLKSTPVDLWVAYLCVYLPVGFFMNEFGKWTKIACFRKWWQVLTCYGIYMVPISILIKDFDFHLQYLWGLFAMCILEFLGYALGTSRALGMTENNTTIYLEGNLLARLFNIKNFALSMAIFFGIYFPLGNWAVSRLHAMAF